MATTGNPIQASDYNSIQSKIALVMGTGSGQSGYGQALASSQVSVGDSISLTAWGNLRTDLLKARQHQTGTDQSGNLTLATSSTVISATIWNQYDTFADTVTTNKFVLGSGESSQETIFASIPVRTSAWNGTLQHVITATFATANDARYFFNAGGSLRHYGDITSPSGGSVAKVNVWNQMFDQVQFMDFNHTATTVTGTGPATVYPIGWYDLTTTDQLLMTKTAPSGTYSASYYEVKAKRNAGSTQVIFTINYVDAATGIIDEDVNGNFTSDIEAVTPDTANVTVNAPTGSSSGFV